MHNVWEVSISPAELKWEAVLNSSLELNYLSAGGRLSRLGKAFSIRRIVSSVEFIHKLEREVFSHDVVDLRKMKPHRFLPSLCIAGRLLYASFICSDGKLFSDNEKMKLFIFIALDTESLRFIRTS